MTSLREAAQQALEALMDDCLVKVGPHSWERRSDLAITALRAALAEPVQESVHEHEKWCASVTQLLLCYPPRKAPCNCKPTAPPQRKPLTEEEIGKVAAPYYGTMGFRVEAFARAIERAHGIGGNT